MVTIVGIQFQKNGALYYYDIDQTTARVGDYVIVETSHGMDLGEVVVGGREVDEQQTSEQMKKILRIATEQDIQHSVENREKEQQAYTICQKKIYEHKLEMKLVSVEYAFDNSKILFFFTANGRIDFRSLVKDLASVFKTRIELRQIGVRDEARMLGGLGQCGRPICCGTFLEDFQPVSIKMAKEQNLSLNPTKISGVCGRLMCCLKYEQEQYEQTRKKMPRMGREIRTPDGTGTVVDLNILKETVTVRFQQGDSSETKVYTLEDLAKPAERKENPENSLEDAEKAEFMQRERELNPETVSDEEKAEQPREDRGAPADRNGARRKPRRPGGPRGQKDGREGAAAEEGEAVREPRQRGAVSKTAHGPNGRREGTAPEDKKTGEKQKLQNLGQPVRRENPQRAKNASGADGSAAKGRGKDRAEKPEKGERPEKSERTEKSERPERPAKPEKQPGVSPEGGGKNRKVSSNWAAELEKAMQNIEK